MFLRLMPPPPIRLVGGGVGVEIVQADGTYDRILPCRCGEQARHGPRAGLDHESHER